jgi:hypothetical protein
MHTTQWAGDQLQRQRQRQRQRKTDTKRPAMQWSEDVQSRASTRFCCHTGTLVTPQRREHKSSTVSKVRTTARGEGHGH